MQRYWLKNRAAFKTYILLTTPTSEKTLFSRMVLVGLMNTGSNESLYVWLANYSLERTVRI